ncbi:MAG: hypothetical protein OXC72_03665 [Roseovarius sp.]|nr:hypothetical protein [Roseovarius sp.]
MSDTLKPSNYQPSKAELEEEHDMPGMTDEQIRHAFFGSPPKSIPKREKIKDGHDQPQYA